MDKNRVQVLRVDKGVGGTSFSQIKIFFLNNGIEFGS